MRKLQYKKRVDNKVEDALSRREGWSTEATLSAIFVPVVDWMDNLKLQYQQDSELLKLFNQWQSNILNSQKFSMRQGLLFFKNRIHVGRAVHLQLQVLNFVHYDSVAGHLGYERTCREPEGIFIGRE